MQDLKQQEELYEQKHGELLGLDNHTEDAKRAVSNMASNLKNSTKKVFKERNMASLKKAVVNLQSDYEEAREKYQMQRETKHLTDKNAADSLLKYVRDNYDKKILETHELLDSKSRYYWTNNTEKIRDVLIDIISGSEVLTDNRRKELERIIITYHKLSFQDNSADTIFNKEHFEKRIKIGDRLIWQSDHLNVDKLTRAYNTNIMLEVNERYEIIEKSHKNSALIWIQNLLDEISENIIDYSPELSKQAQNITFMTKQLEDLKLRKEKLEEYTKTLHGMMDWKTIL